MIAVTRGVGAALVVVGVVAYVVSDAASATALLPALLGVVIGALGFLAANERFHRHAIHAALAVALLAFLGTVPRALPLLTGGEPELPVAAWASLVTALLTLVYVGLGVRSFVRARRAGAATGS